MEGICITHSCIPLYTVYMQHIMAHSGGMQEWVIQIPSIPILVSVLFPSLHLKYFRIKFLLLPYIRKFSLLKYFRMGCWHTKIKRTKIFQQRIFTTRLFFYSYRLREGTRTSSEPSLQVSSRPRLPSSLLYLPP